MNIAIIGYGRMGHMIEQIAVERGHTVCATIDVDNLADFDSKGFRQADVVIEFTHPTSAYDNVERCFAQGKKVVCGTTGWIHEHEDELRQQCAKGQTLLWASNFSIGMALFDNVSRHLARLMNGMTQYDISLDETHHIHKADAPSGTAITLAEHIIDAVERKTRWQLTGNASADSPEVLPISSIRRSETPGTHAIHYDSDIDTITITHTAHTRKGLALGAVIAAEYVHTHQGWLTIDDVVSQQ